jgi:phosphatidylserine/phosphatidylglycerophosphate/cardiolipin synthase-like enzyme
MGIEDAKKWFITPGDKTGVGRVDTQCYVDAFVDAEEYYTALRKDIEDAANSSSPSDYWLFWIGFECSADCWMPSSAPAPGTIKKYSPRARQSTDREMLDLLKHADQKGVKLRALLTLHPKPDTGTAKDRYLRHNFTLCQTINQQFRNAFVINDYRYLYMNGVHHQKFFLIFNGRAVTAYAGGIDIERARIEYCWCDFHCRFVGPPAEYLFGIFESRWKEHFAVKTPKIGFDANHEKLPNVGPWPARQGSLLCQVTDTFGNPQRANPFAFIPGQNADQNVNQPHRLEIAVPIPNPITPFTSFTLTTPNVHIVSNALFATRDKSGLDIVLHEQNQPRMYQFAPKGHHAIYDAVKHAVSIAERFIYIEDQYLVCDQPMGQLAGMLDVLKSRLKESSALRLVVLTTRIDEINPEFQGTAWAHRGPFLRDLHAAAPDRVAICQYQSQKELGRGDSVNSPFYIHSKTWIFDDKLLISGSANCNRRGYSHDSELDFAIYDLEGAWVRDVRARIWMRRLYTEGCFKPPTMAELRDLNNATVWDRWFKPYRYTKDLESSAYRHDQSGERRGQPNDLQPIAHPDRSPTQLESDLNTFFAAFGILVRVDQAIARFLWDYIVDPDGT